MNPLLTRMLACADPSQVEGLSRFFKTGPGQYGEGDKFLGIKVPVTRAVVKACWRELLPADGHAARPKNDHAARPGDAQTIFPELEECIRSEYHEVRLAALLTLVEIFHYAKKAAEKTGMLQKQCIDFYLAHTAYINNWDLVDLSCYPLLGEWLLDKDRTLLYDLARNGKTLWEQRIGIVSTMTFIRHGQLEDTFALADILLHHPHDLIHKAVGWLLREAGKRDKAALEAYLKGAPAEAVGWLLREAGKRDKAALEAYLKGAPAEAVGAAEDGALAEAGAAVRQPATSRYRNMPRTMLRYAIERFPEAERQAYLAK